MTHLGVDLELATGQWGALYAGAIAHDLMSDALPVVERVGCLPGGGGQFHGALLWAAAAEWVGPSHYDPADLVERRRAS